MLARIGVLKALHRDRVREFTSDRKETHWGKRKLKRDQWRSATGAVFHNLAAFINPS
jgi:hypothetical protein